MTMKIGMTYDLRDDYLGEGYTLEETAEFDRADTIDALDEAIRACSHETERIGNAKQLVQRLARGERWDLVFNIAEGLHGMGREALVPALLDAYEIPYTFSDPLVLALTLHKGMTKAVLQGAGVPTADFAVVSAPAEVETVSLPYPLFVKPVAEGTGKGISDASLVKTPAELRPVCEKLLAEFRQQVLVETFLPGREFTAGVVGTGEEASAVGVMEVLFKKKEPADLIYSYHNKSNYEQVIEYRAPEPEVIGSCAELALSAWKVLGCRDGGRVDIRMDGQGRPNFIEVNPLAGLNPVHSDLPILCRLNNISFQELMERILESAFKRINRGR